jgi:L-rhamnose-H+ transport protein
VTTSFAAGLALVLLAGVLQGSFMLPSKWMRQWQWENYWLVFSIFAYLICPWAVAVATIPNLAEVYRASSWQEMTPVVLFGIGWGLGALSFGLGVEALGLSLGFAVILGVAATAGTLIPLAVLPAPDLSSMQVALMLAALITMLVGVAVCSWAGRWREAQPVAGARRSYGRGLVICVASGLLSSCGNLGYAWGEAIYQRAGEAGVASYLAPNALWPLLTPPLLVCNAGYALVLLRRHRSFKYYADRGSATCAGWAIIMGLMWFAGMAVYGIGGDRLGALGKSLGWAMFISSMILVSTLLGVLSGEWKAAPARSRRELVVGLIVLMIAIAGLGYTNALD